MIKIDNIYFGLMIDYEADHHYRAIIIKDGAEWFMFENNNLISLAANQVIEDSLVPLRKYLNQFQKLNICNSDEVDVDDIHFVVNQVKLELNKQRIRS